MTVTIEVIAASGCKKCADGTRDDLRAVAAAVLGEEELVWREVNVLEELDYAISLGVLTMPAMAVNGKLEFPSLPTPEQLRTALQKREIR